MVYASGSRVVLGHLVPGRENQPKTSVARGS